MALWGDWLAAVGTAPTHQRPSARLPCGTLPSRTNEHSSSLRPGRIRSGSPEGGAWCVREKPSLIGPPAIVDCTNLTLELVLLHSCVSERAREKKSPEFQRYLLLILGGSLSVASVTADEGGVRPLSKVPRSQCRCNVSCVHHEKQPTKQTIDQTIDPLSLSPSFSHSLALSPRIANMATASNLFRTSSSTARHVRPWDIAAEILLY